MKTIFFALVLILSTTSFSKNSISSQDFVQAAEEVGLYPKSVNRISYVITDEIQQTNYYKVYFTMYDEGCAGANIPGGAEGCGPDFDSTYEECLYMEVDTTDLSVYVTNYTCEADLEDVLGVKEIDEL